MLLGRFLPRGVAVHHAGLLPQVKLLVEEFFQAGKLRAVFATDTLAPAAARGGHVAAMAADRSCRKCRRNVEGFDVS